MDPLGFILVASQGYLDEPDDLDAYRFIHTYNRFKTLLTSENFQTAAKVTLSAVATLGTLALNFD